MAAAALGFVGWKSFVGSSGLRVIPFQSSEKMRLVKMHCYVVNFAVLLSVLACAQGAGEKQAPE